MVAVVAGSGLGLSDSSSLVLGARGQVGDPAFGRFGDRVYVNSVTGNLVIQKRDELLLGRGLDVPVHRTYNSLGQFTDDNADNWRLSCARLVHSLTGTLNSAGSTVTRTDWDGAEIVFTYNAARSRYESTAGDGAYDTLTFNSAANTWAFTDGNSRTTETYDAANGGRITAAADADGNTVTYSYTNNRLTEVRSANGESVQFTYAGNNVTQVRTVTASGTQTRVHYAYDGLNRLSQVIVDLTPADNTPQLVDANSDGLYETVNAQTYVTTYTYDGTSKRVASITDGDGTKVSFTYVNVGGNWRVQTVTDGLGRVSSFDYAGGSSSEATATANSAALSTTAQQEITTPYTLDTSQLAPVTSGNNRLVDGVMLTGLSAAAGSETVYEIEVPPGTGVLQIKAGGTQGDGDFYLRHGAVPTTDTYDYRGWDYSDSGEAIIVNNPAAGTWYLVAHAYTAYSGVSLVAELGTSPVTGALQNGVAVTDLHSNHDTDLVYTINVPSGASDLKFVLTGGLGDIDLYVRHGAAPVFDPFAIDYWSEHGDNEETVSISNPAAGTWYVLAKTWPRSGVDYGASTGARLTAYYNLGSNTPPVLDAGADKTAAAGAAVSLTATASDTEGSIASIQWTQVDGPAVTLNGATTLTASFTAPSVSTPTRLRFKVTVTDNQGVQSAETVSVAVLPANLVYVVQSGDTWSAIANRLYGVNSAEAGAALAQALGNPTLTAGAQLSGFPETLNVTTTETVSVAPYYTVQSGDTWTSITQTVYGTGVAEAVQALRDATGDPALIAGLHLTVPATLTYTIPGALGTQTQITDALGGKTLLVYDANGRLTQVVAPAVNGTNQTLSFTYTTKGDVATVKDAKDNVVTYQYDADGNLTLQRDQAGNTVTRTYGASNELLTETVYFTPDPDGAGAATAADPATTRYSYDAENHLRYIVTADGRVTEYRYETPGNRTAAIDYAGTRYDVSGLSTTAAISAAALDAWRDAIADKSKTIRIDYAYDARGALTTETRYSRVGTNGVGLTDVANDYTQIGYVYDPFGSLLQRLPTQGSASAELFTYDGLGRVLSSTDLNLAATVNFYDDVGTQARVTLANGLTRTQVFNQAGHLLALVEGQSGATLAQIHYRYDALGRLRYTEDATGVRTHFLYDAASRKVAEIDADGSLTEFFYDANNQLTQTRRYVQLVSTSAMAALVAADGTPSNVALGAAGSAVTSSSIPRPANDPADRTTWRLYDTANRLHKEIDAAGAVVEYFYDGASRLVKTTAWATPINLATFAANPTSANATPAIDAVNDRTTRRFYDNDGRLRGVLDGEGYLVEYQYHVAGNRTLTLRYADATDPAQRATGALAQLVATRGNAKRADDITETALHDGRGLLRQTIDGEGNAAAYDYDQYGNVVKEISGFKLDPASAINVTTFVRDPYGQVQIAARTLTGGATETDVYAYDALRRLTSQMRAGGSADARQAQFRYDIQGRLIAELSGRGSEALAVLGANPTPAQIDAVWTQWAVHHAYDAAGRRVSTTDANGNQTLYYYNGDGRLTHTVNAAGEVVEQRYNAFNELQETIAYATRLASAALATLSGGLVNGALTSAVDGIADSTLDSSTVLTYENTGALVCSARHYLVPVLLKRRKSTRSRLEPQAKNGVFIRSFNIASGTRGGSM